jgi:hypothetical protein
MADNEKALHDVRRKIAEKLDKDDKKLVFGWNGQSEPTRVEGDVWEDVNGKQWTIKNGIRQTITKLDTAKTPYWCPKCSKPMNHKLDIKFWRIRGHCMDCNVKLETELRRQGKWEEFERKTMLRNYIAEVKDKIAELQHYHDTVSNPEVINADDTNILMMERWEVDIDKVKTDLMRDIEKLKGYLHDAIEKYGTGEDDDQSVQGVSKDHQVNE